MLGMIQDPESDLRVGMLSVAAWQKAIESPGTPETDEQHISPEWEAAGLQNESGENSQDWLTSIEVVRKAPTGIQLVSIYDEVVFSASVFLLDETAVSVTARGIVEKTAEGGERLGQAHPMLEIALVSESELWAVLRRTLPPLPQFRSPAKRTCLPESVVPLPRDHLSTGSAASAGSMRITRLPEVPKEARDLVQPKARVFVFASHQGKAGFKEHEVAWALGKSGLYRIEGKLLKVSTGDVSARLARLANEIRSG